MAFTWVSSPSSISIIHRFGLFILSQIPWMPRFLIYSSHSLWMIDPFFYFVFKTWHFLFHFIPSVGETFFWACCVTSCLFSFPEVTMGVRLHAFCPSSTVSLNSIPESRAASSWMLAAMRTYSFQRWPIGNCPVSQLTQCISQWVSVLSSPHPLLGWWPHHFPLLL